MLKQSKEIALAQKGLYALNLGSNIKSIKAF